MSRNAIGVGLLAGLALLTTALSAQTWDVPGPSDRADAVRLDSFGHQARVSLDAPRPHTVGDRSYLYGAGWIGLGPFGGDVDDVAASPTDPSIVLAGIAPNGSTGGTLYHSTDAGATWTEVAALSGISVHDIEFDASGKIYLGTMDGVWTSTDDGVNWTAQNLGIGLNDQTFEVTIDPNDANRIWAGVADAMGSQTMNVLLSTDGGVTWTLVGNHGLPGAAYGSAFLPDAPTPTWIAVGPTGSSISVDGGTSWRVFDADDYWSVAAGPGGAVWAVGPGGSVAQLTTEPELQ